MSKGFLDITELVTAAIVLVNTVMVIINSRVAARNSKNIVLLEKNTNSLKDALVDLTAKSSFAAGLKAGQES
jgi:hypothetical protein